LLALLTGQRVQTLKCISIDNLCIEADRCVIKINSLLKTTRPGKHLEPVILKAFSNPELCIVKHINVYINTTSALRGTNKQLLISYLKPHEPVSCNTISRWIKRILYSSGIDINKFKAHSTRSATCSKMATLVPVEQILKTAGWSNAKTFAKFYNKPINKDSDTETVSQKLLLAYKH
jgi:hypothetical protein